MVKLVALKVPASTNRFPNKSAIAPAAMVRNVLLTLVARSDKFLMIFNCVGSRDTMAVLPSEDLVTSPPISVIEVEPLLLITRSIVSREVWLIKSLKVIVSCPASRSSPNSVSTGG